MKYAQLAKEYRLDGRYLLALSSAEASQTVSGLIEACRALCWLAKYDSAQDRLNALSQPKGLERIDYFNAVIICAINLGYWERCRQLMSVLEKELEQSAQIDIQIRLHQLIAQLYAVLDDHDKSIPHAELALALAESFAEKRLLCDSLFGYADALHRAQRYAETIPLWSRCIETQRNTLRPDHPEIAISLDAFALSLRQLNQADAAIPLHLKAQQIYHSELPPYHPALGASYHGLSQALLRCGQNHQAVRSMRLALQCAENNLPSDHPDIAITQFELGRAECSIGEHQMGLQRMQAAYHTGQSILGAQHSMVQRMKAWIDQLAEASSSEGASDESESDSSDSSDSSNSSSGS